MSEPDLTFATLDPGTDERFVSLRRQLSVSAFGMNLLVLQPHQRGRIHAHERQEEVYMVTEGELALVVEGKEHTCSRRTGWLASVRSVPRQLVNRGPERLVVLALGGSGEHVGRDGRAWEFWEEGGEGRPPQEVPLPEDLRAGLRTRRSAGTGNMGGTASVRFEAALVELLELKVRNLRRFQC